MYHAYNADGIRTAKLSCGILTSFLPDGGDVAAEMQNDVLTASYLRGCNLICREQGGAVTKDYDYDAFGCERSPDSLDKKYIRTIRKSLKPLEGLYFKEER